ncbi:MAG TPA: endonuclease/exonuclease/phosphatase family protein [Vicinamibacteria bacterium]|jgi:endonuclease/exonuclease/phosphatase (EEP) superfamily protein YafD
MKGNTNLDTFLRFVAAALAGATVLGGLGQLAWWLELFAHFPLQYAAGLLACALYFASRREVRVALAATAVALANLYLVAPQFFSEPALAAERGEILRFAHSNLHKRNHDTESVLRFVVREMPDLLLLEELTPDWRERLEGLGALYPHSITVPRKDGYGIALFSRRPFLSEEVLYFQPGVPSLAVRLTVAGEPVLFLGAHPPAPVTPRRYRVRNAVFEGLAGRARASSEPVVLLGDLNSTPWGQSYQKLLSEAGLRDTSEGRGLQWSWPSFFWPAAIPIDHCLVSPELRVATRRTGPFVGSDHYPLVVDLVFPVP